MRGALTVADDSGDNAIALALDVTKEEQWQHCIAECIRHFGRLDTVVNGAGIGFSGNFEESPIEKWQAMLDVNLTGVMLGCKHGIKGIRSSGDGGQTAGMPGEHSG